jgi:hypothetical protein
MKIITICFVAHVTHHAFEKANNNNNNNNNKKGQYGGQAA